ncbi:MAG TPA: inositol monophosphatase family protein [Gemmatimonadales bacterium]|jgi:histidinol phosphatase-like enzyme (inositol monophosphatase family)|nr:inositol monophosphatase family protein [Gemmatimonadales bacterium]
MGESGSSLLEAAAELAGLTAGAALQYYRKNVAVERKGDGSPVTIADRSAEQLARDWIARRFPADAILGEELGAVAGTSGRTWLLDPVDGTKTFVRGVPLWGSLVAIVEGDVVLAGAAAFPALDERIAAAPGEGCWHNGRRARVSELARLAEATVLTTDEHGFAEPKGQRAWNQLAGAAAVVRTWGDCYGYLLVATGRAEVMVDAKLNPWDSACFVPIIREAGGAITELAGLTAWNLASAVATNAALATEVRRYFQ